jgi:excisionase family DNA binding protein
MESVRTEQLLTAKEVAHRLHVPVTWVYTKAERDELPCVRIRRYVRFDLDVVMASFAEGRSG